MNRTVSFLSVALVVMVVSGCGDDHGHAPAPAAAAEPASNRIPIPAAVRANLGLTFAKAEYRVVAATRRFPGRFELDVDARQAYTAAFPGQVELLARPYQPVAAGQPLYRLAGRGWAELRLPRR